MNNGSENRQSRRSKYHSDLRLLDHKEHPHGSYRVYRRRARRATVRRNP